VGDGNVTTAVAGRWPGGGHYTADSESCNYHDSSVASKIESGGKMVAGSFICRVSTNWASQFHVLVLSLYAERLGAEATWGVRTGVPSGCNLPTAKAYRQGQANAKSYQPL